VSTSDLSIPMLGNGTGRDALPLTKHGFRVVVYDLPGSKVMDFAIRRFEYCSITGERMPFKM
jgi:hypothetical protein